MKDPNTSRLDRKNLRHAVERLLQKADSLARAKERNPERAPEYEAQRKEALKKSTLLITHLDQVLQETQMIEPTSIEQLVQMVDSKVAAYQFAEHLMPEGKAIPAEMTRKVAEESMAVMAGWYEERLARVAPPGAPDMVSVLRSKAEQTFREQKPVEAPRPGRLARWKNAVGRVFGTKDPDPGRPNVAGAPDALRVGQHRPAGR